MYKLTIIGGPNRGSSFPIRDGENSIGRHSANAIVLASAKVSKKHCVLLVQNGEIMLQDQGSSNGTFVNGNLVKSRKIKPGDRISVGEYVLELDDPSARMPKQAPPVAGMGGVVKIPGFTRAVDLSTMGAQSQSRSLPMPPSPSGVIGMPSAPSSSAAALEPKDFAGKVLWFLDQQVLPFFYNLNLKHEWRHLLIGAFIVFVLGNLFISVQPLVDSGRVAVVKESGRRATFMAKLIADRNSQAIAAKMYTKAEIGPLIENDKAVRVALLTDTESQVIAPGSKMNQYLTVGKEAVFAVKARDLFRNGRETGMVEALSEGSITAIEPVKAYAPNVGRNIVVGMAIVTVDTSIATPSSEQMGLVYSQVLIVTGILAALILFVLHRVTLRPYRILSEDMDKALKGEIPQVTHEYQVEEMNELWNLVNSALQRVSRNVGSSGGPAVEAAPSLDDYLAGLRMIGDLGKFGLVACDAERKIVYLNPMFEEISGIRADSSIGQTFNAVARDQSLGVFTGDQMDRAASGEVPSEDYDFSGISYRVQTSAVGSPASPRGFVVVIARVEG